MELQLMSNRELSPQGEVRVPSRHLAQSNAGQDPETGSPPRFAFHLSKKLQIRQSVLTLFPYLSSSAGRQFRALTNRQWKSLLQWLDVSGLALYFLDQITVLDFERNLPSWVVSSLQRRLTDNSSRTRGIIKESVEIQLSFQEAGVSYAILKGLSLYPISVPRPELRHQFDLDFLVAEKDLPAARQTLVRRGYRLCAVSGNSWEFKLNDRSFVRMEDMYKDLPGRSVELHVESPASDQNSRLNRAVTQHMHGISMPVLSPVDLFLEQGLHAFKDVCSAHARAAHLVEFYRHILAQSDNESFWNELNIKIDGDRRAQIALGVVTYLLSTIMGNFAPDALRESTVNALPATIRLWVDLYGTSAACGEFPGTKLYLLLQKELEIAGVPARRAVNKQLLPSRLPPPVIRSTPGQTLLQRLHLALVQIRYIFARGRFHIVEGARYVWESRRWRHYRMGIAK